MGRDRDPGVKRGGMVGLRRKKGGKEPARTYPGSRGPFSKYLI